MKFQKSTLVMSCMILAGCATATRGTSETVKIYASPEGATIATNIGETCNTSPCIIEVNRKQEFTVTVSKEGYHTQTVEVATKVAPNGAAGMAGNILIGGVIGAGVDVATGATLDHSPNPVLVELVPMNSSDPKGDLSEIRAEIEAKQKRQSEAVMRQTGGV